MALEQSEEASFSIGPGRFGLADAAKKQYSRAQQIVSTEAYRAIT